MTVLAATPTGSRRAQREAQRAARGAARRSVTAGTRSRSVVVRREASSRRPACRARWSATRRSRLRGCAARSRRGRGRSRSPPGTRPARRGARARTTTPPSRAASRPRAPRRAGGSPAPPARGGPRQRHPHRARRGRSAVRYRIDGVLHESPRPPQDHAAIVSRVKIMAELNIAEKRLPQDGRIRCSVAGQRDRRPRLHHPHGHGEGIVMRICSTRRACMLDLRSSACAATSSRRFDS